MIFFLFSSEKYSIVAVKQLNRSLAIIDRKIYPHNLSNSRAAATETCVKKP